MEPGEVQATDFEHEEVKEVAPAPRMVECRICHEQVKSTGLSGHIGAHPRTKTKRWRKADYLEKFGKDTDADFDHWVPPPETRERIIANLQQNRAANGTNQPRDPELPVMTPTAQLRSQLQPNEQAEFDQIYNIVFDEVDRDEVQAPRVASYAFYTVMLTRLMSEQTLKNYKPNKDHEDAISKTDMRIQKLADALGISRQEKLKNRATSKSSVASLISGYVDELERSTTEVLQTKRDEENKQLAVMEERIQRFILDAAPTIDAEEATDEPVVPDIDEIIGRANISL